MIKLNNGNQSTSRRSASPLASALFHDEPTIDVLNSIGMDVNAAGNHEFDEGYAELLRIQRGGCHPVDGCQYHDDYDGARFPILGADELPVTVNNFLADGGDGFVELRNGTNRTGGAVDLDAFAAYLAAHPNTAPPAINRITTIA